MKQIFFLFTFMLIAFGSYSNDFCRAKHILNNTDYSTKSNIENLRSDTIDIINYDIYLDFTMGSSGILSGNCQILFEAKMNVGTISLDLLQMNIDSVIAHGNPISYSYNDTLLLVQLPSPLSIGALDSITVYYNGSPQTDPSGWGGFYMNANYYYNLGVGFVSDPHNYGRVWHPCFDNFVERATYDFSILTNNQFTAYCNGTRTNVQTVGTDSLLTDWSMTTEIPSYLAAVAISNYTHVELNYFSSLQGINIPIWLVAQSSDTSNFKSSFINLNSAIEAFETLFGPYIWNRVGYVAVPFNAGAMEHATHIAYPLATINGTTTYESLMAHELSHHWWGDWVTTETAEEMWINEGMATYCEELFTEWQNGYDAYMNDVRTNHYDMLHRAHIDDSGHYALNAVPIKWTYGNHSYQKAADVIHSLRSYMGDANFYAGLQVIQTNYGGKDINSSEFMAELNSIAGVDVTDFFTDWIFQPGYPHFSISGYTSVANGGGFDVQVVVNQKLKGAASYYNNVPLELTFMDANWNKYTTMISASGDWEVFTLTVPFDPVFVGINLNEKISDATTGISDTITTTGTKTYNHANLRLSVTSLTDSVMLRVEHNWVWADVVGVPDNIQISRDRYWNIHGIDLDKLEGELRFTYDGRNAPASDFDNSIMQNAGGVTFREDSLVLLYRPNTASNWQIHSDYTLYTQGNPTDKKGYMIANTFAPGQYAFGTRVSSVGINEQSKELTYSIYPNPTSDSMHIDLTNWPEDNYAIEIYAIHGQKVDFQRLKGKVINAVSIGHLSEGTYIVVLRDGQNKRIGTKRIVLAR